MGSTAGVAADFGTQGSSRGAAWGDYDNDGDLDLYLATSIGEQNRLYRNDLDIDGSRRFNVEETGSPEPHLGLRGQVKHQGKVKALHLDVPGKRKAKGHLKNAENAQVPTAYALHPARPNPFNPVTQIAYQLPEPGEVELVVYDLMGQKIRVLTQGHQEVGFYQVGWDGQDEARHEVASGIYLCRLKTKGFEETRRMALIR